MAYGTLAVKLAKSLDVPLSKASQFVDDVGASRARQMVEDVSEGASRTVGNWWKPGLVGGTVIGGGYALREQDVRRMRQIAEKSQSQEETVRSIVESDMSPEARKKLLDMYLSNAGGSGGSGSGSGGSGGGLLNDVMGDATSMIVLLIVLVVVLNEVLDQ